MLAMRWGGASGRVQSLRRPLSGPAYLPLLDPSPFSYYQVSYLPLSQLGYPLYSSSLLHFDPPNFSYFTLVATVRQD